MIAMPKIDGITWHGDDPRPPRIEYLIEGLMPTTGVGLLIGQPTVGKTFLTIDMARAIATGEPLAGEWLPYGSNASEGKEPVDYGATLFVAGEGINTYETRVQAAYESLTFDARCRLREGAGLSHLPICWMHAHDLRDDNAYRRCLEKACHVSESIRMGLCGPRLRLRLIVVDTLPSVFGFRDENSAAEAVAAMSKLARLSKETETFVLATGHPKKAGTRTGGMRGSGVFDGAADVVLEAKMKDGGKSRILIIRKSRYQPTLERGCPFHITSMILEDGAESGVVQGRVCQPDANGKARDNVASRLVLDAQDVRTAMQRVVQSHCFVHMTSEGEPVEAVYASAVRNELYAMKPIEGDANDPMSVSRHRDRIRKTITRGTARLKELGLIGQQHPDGHQSDAVLWFRDR